VKERVAVVGASTDCGACDGLGFTLSEALSYMAESPDMEVSRLADVLMSAVKVSQWSRVTPVLWTCGSVFITCLSLSLSLSLCVCVSIY